MKLNNFSALFFILLHGILSLSSFIFHLPNLRNTSKPMIYPEFRLHSIVFALRSVIICFLYYYKFHFIYPILICYGTMISADVITFFYNPNGKNGKTMRNMPFDVNIIPSEKQIQITNMHSLMQIGATTYMLCDIESTFSPLLAIQLAAFLMTLVRKSIITSTTWHAIYSLTLWINVVLYTGQPMGFIIIHQIMLNNFTYVFFPLKINKYFAWSINFCLFIIYKESLLEFYINDLCNKNNKIVFLIKDIIIIYAFTKFFTKFKFLFLRD
jgi:hypothetical protein